jgi:hypothetical protein
MPASAERLLITIRKALQRSARPYAERRSGPIRLKAAGPSSDADWRDGIYGSCIALSPSQLDMSSPPGPDSDAAHPPDGQPVSRAGPDRA